MSEADDRVNPEHAAHTAEHILNAVMHRDYGTGRSIEAHFGNRKSKCDYRVDRPFDEEDIRRIEAAVNAEIRADHPVTTFTVDRVEADARYDMRKVPQGASAIRIVRIGDLDVIPCIGQHVDRTGRLGRFVVRSFDMRDDSTLRIRFTFE